jgi:hypothetical protein
MDKILLLLGVCLLVQCAVVPFWATADRERAEDEYRFQGKVTAMGPGYLDINDQTVSINGDTELEGTLAIGSNVEVKAILEYANTFVAKKVEVKESTEK